jgi:hypothetical protein
MADCYYGGGRTMYSNTDECYDVGRHGNRRMYSHTDEYDVDRRRPGGYADDCYDGGYGGRQAAVYTDDEYSRGGGYGGRQTAVYTDDEYSRGGGYGGEQQQQYYKKEEKQHKHRERLGEVGALAGGAFALVTIDCDDMNN